MYHMDGNPATCRHSKGRSVTGLGKQTLAVYSTCKHPRKKQIGKQHYMENVYCCEICMKCQAR